ncbi:hypothetical protein OAF54_00290 [bacterium]|nr:hypothetical protein [bacterium]
MANVYVIYDENLDEDTPPDVVSLCDKCAASFPEDIYEHEGGDHWSCDECGERGKG